MENSRISLKNLNAAADSLQSGMQIALGCPHIDKGPVGFPVFEDKDQGRKTTARATKYIGQSPKYKLRHGKSEGVVDHMVAAKPTNKFIISPTPKIDDRSCREEQIVGVLSEIMSHVCMPLSSPTLPQRTS